MFTSLGAQTQQVQQLHFQVWLGLHGLESTLITHAWTCFDEEVHECKPMSSHITAPGVALTGQG